MGGGPLQLWQLANGLPLYRATRRGGARVLAGIGLYFYGARWYDAGLGRFTSPDTIIPAQQGVVGNDRYAYTNNNPLRFTDPTGHSVVCGLGKEGCEDGAEVSKDIQEEDDNQASGAELTNVQKVGKGLTYLVVMTIVVAPTELSLIIASLAVAGSGPEGLVVDALLLPAEIAIADFAISYGIKTYKEITSGQEVEFEWIILPALASILPNPIQEELHNMLPTIFP